MLPIEWPDGYVPGFADNFASNEVIVAGLCIEDCWRVLIRAELWPTYYGNAAHVRIREVTDGLLRAGSRFSFETFGIEVHADVVEFVEGSGDGPWRLAWHGWAGEGQRRIDVHHAWLLQELPGGRVRILTQETQNGPPAIAMANAKPNPLINGHQDWLDGLVAEARRREHRQG